AGRRFADPGRQDGDRGLRRRCVSVDVRGKRAEPRRMWLGRGPMTRAPTTALKTTVLLAAAGLALAAGATAAPYKVAHNGYGQPDLTGAWSNATLTPQARPALYGTRKTFSADEVKLLEGVEAAKDAAGRKSIGDTGASVGAYDR